MLAFPHGIDIEGELFVLLFSLLFLLHFRFLYISLTFKIHKGLCFVVNYISGWRGVLLVSFRFILDFIYEFIFILLYYLRHFFLLLEKLERDFDSYLLTGVFFNNLPVQRVITIENAIFWVENSAVEQYIAARENSCCHHLLHLFL